MKALSYEISEKLYESECTVVYRGYRAQDNKPAILKVLKPEATTDERLASFKYEFDIISKLDIPGVVKAIGLEAYDGGLMMALEDIGGESLDRILEKGALSLSQSIELGIALADTVGQVHQRHIIHKDFNPSNIIWNPVTGQINIIDFGLADETPERNVAPQPPSALEGTLEYISPEQTGRMNRPVDYRTDFYSLGVTLYQILTGKLPFEADDALGMVHSHIAKSPVPPHDLNSDVPEMVSEIVMKLMAKMADDRYQSAWGLESDLERCLRELIDTGSIEYFELGLEDFSDQLRVPHKLYGRQKETERLLAAFDRVAAGERELLMVAGYSGIGKTALVHETHRPIAEKNGYFIEGKFDQLQRNVPYFAWIQAFTGFANYLLMENEEELKRWKDVILASVGSIGKVLTDVIPNLELIIGPQPDVPDLAPSESQNRFNYVFLEFIRALATSEHPLVVFLDDLQWIDAASLNLLQILMNSPGVSNILIIGAYRDNEVDTLHPLSMAIEALRKEHANIEMLTLGNLSEQTINELIANTLHYSSSKTVSLTHLIYSKTGGNPFFLLQTLRALVDKQAIAFDAQRRCWNWDMTALKAMEITDNVIDLMLGKIKQLAPETQHILPLAACIGFRFNANNLGTIARQPEAVALDSLHPALREGLIAPLDGEYQFAHDRIQQAAYSLIPDSKKKQVHLDIGRLLLEHLSEIDHDEQLFTVVDHLNIGSDLLKTSDEKLKLARLNLRAGFKAKSSAAFSAATNYFHAALHLLPANPWERQYELCMELHKESSECEYLIGNHTAADAYIAKAIQYSKNASDKASVYSIQVAMYTTQGRFLESTTVGISALRLLGLDLPDPADSEAVGIAAERALARCREHLSSISIPALIDAPEVNDPKVKACGDILAQMALAAYFLNRALYTLTVATLVDLSLHSGNSVATALGYVLMAAISITQSSDFQMAGKLGRLSQELLQRYHASSLSCKILQFYCNTVAPWFLPLAEVIKIQQQALIIAMESGTPEDAANNHWGIFRSMFSATSAPLNEILRECDATIAYADSIHNEVFRDSVIFLRRPTAYLQHSIPDEQESDEASLLQYYENIGFLTIPAHYNIFKAWALFMMGRSNEALCYTTTNEKFIECIADQPTITYHYFHQSLLLLRGQKPKEQLAKVTENQKRLLLFQESCPANYKHMHLLVEAERARVEGLVLEAMDLYDEAINVAAENNSNYVEGTACELAAEFWMTLQKEQFAALYIQRAHRAFVRWQAWAKVKALETKYPQWLGREASEHPIPKMRSIRSLDTEAKILDLDTVMKATHAISSEIEMDKLLSEVMHIAIENAGAQGGYLLFEQDGDWQIVASGGTVTAGTAASLPVDMNGNDLVARSVILFVARTKESVVLDDATQSGSFGGDPYIRSKKTKSLLCAPLLSRGRLIGILYLENNLTTHAFTPDRVQLLGMLLSQAATSIENSSIYEALKKSEFNYRQIVDTANEGIWVLGPDFITTSVNAKMAKMLGYKPEEMVGKALTDFMYKEDWPDHYKQIELRKKGLATTYERRFRHKYQREVWTLASATPVFDGEKHFAGSFVMFTDITERKLAEEALSRAEEEKRNFYRETIRSVTNGKLEICDQTEIQPYNIDSIIVETFHNAAELSDMRQQVEEFLASKGLHDETLTLFTTGVGEAMTNALKHADGGTIFYGAGDIETWVGISDTGPGIAALTLPSATLMRGYSTKISMGMGYTIMLDISDRIMLNTSSEGTTVILIKNLFETKQFVSLMDLPDTWDMIT